MKSEEEVMTEIEQTVDSYLNIGFLEDVSDLELLSEIHLLNTIADHNNIAKLIVDKLKTELKRRIG